MDETKIAHALTQATTILEGEHDIAGFLDHLLETCQRELEVDAIGTMLRTETGRLQLLGASTHRAAELELHQSQIDEGPCVDAAELSQSIAVTGEEQLVTRWPTFGASMVERGYLSVHSTPLRWKEETLGAIALFRKDAQPFTPEEDRAAQAFADLVSRLVMSGEHAEVGDTDRLIHAALSSRLIIEQAKGVLAQERGLDMSDAYDLLRSLAADRNETLSAVAHDVVARAARGGGEPSR